MRRASPLLFVLGGHRGGGRLRHILEARRQRWSARPHDDLRAGRSVHDERRHADRARLRRARPTRPCGCSGSPPTSSRARSPRGWRCSRGANVIDVDGDRQGARPGADRGARHARDAGPRPRPRRTARATTRRAAWRGSACGSRTEDGGGLLEGMLPGAPGVCEQGPSAGSEARRGDIVTVLVAKRC